MSSTASWAPSAPVRDGIGWALWWLADAENPTVRANRATVFVYQLGGLGSFHGCRSVEDLLDQHQIAKTTFYALKAECRAHGFGA